MNILTAVIWNPRDRRLRALWRLLLMLALIGAIAVAPIVGLGEGLVALHEQGLWLPAFSPAMFDKSMDFIVGPLFAVLIIAAVLFRGSSIAATDARSVSV